MAKKKESTRSQEFSSNSSKFTVRQFADKREDVPTRSCDHRLPCCLATLGANTHTCTESPTSLQWLPPKSRTGRTGTCI